MRLTHARAFCRTTEICAFGSHKHLLIWSSRTTSHLKTRTMRRFRWLLWLIVCALSWRVVAGQSGGAKPSTTASIAIVAPTASPGLVWVNTRSKIYHYPGHRWYGGTQQGKYVSEAEAIAEGDRAAQNERRPLNFGATTVVAQESSQPTPPEALTAETPARTPPAILRVTPAPTPVSEVGPTPDTTPSFTTKNPSVVEPKEQLSVCIQAIAAQSDPAKLATLGERGANPRLKRIMYYLALARAGGADPGNVIDEAQRQNGSLDTPRAALVKTGLLRNLKICDGLGLLTPENLAGLRRGAAPTVTRGPYAGQTAEVDHIVPLAQARGIGNELANLEMLPASLNRAKSDKVGERQLALAGRFHGAGLLSDAELAQVQTRFRPAGTEKYELPTP